MENIHATQKWVSNQLNEIGFSEDIANLKLYQTTDVYTLTEDDIYVDNGTLKYFKKPELIEHDIVIIPEGITSISPEELYDENIYPISIKAQKIICPSTLKSIYTTSGSYDETMNHNLDFYDSELILNEGLESIDLTDPNRAWDISLSHYPIVLPSTLKNIDSMYGIDIICHKLTNKLNFTCEFPFNANLYIYDKNMDFSNIKFGNYEQIGDKGTIYGHIGSTAQKFAQNNGYTFKNIEDYNSIIINNKQSAFEVIRPNEFYSFTKINSLSVELTETSNNQLDEFMFSFVTPEIADNSFLQITSNKEIQWVKEPNIKPNYIYEVSIVNNVGVIAGIPNKEVSE